MPLVDRLAGLLINDDRSRFVDELEQLLARPAWHADAACLERPPAWFFPGTGSSSGAITRAKLVCAGCLARDDCLDWALTNDDDHLLAGVWAGTTQNDRADIRAGRRTIAECQTVEIRDRATKPERMKPAPLGDCECCARIGDVHPAQHRGDVAGRLPAPRDLCHATYQYVHRSGRLPTVDELEHRARHGRWTKAGRRAA